MMPNRNDRFWGDIAGKIRRALSLRPLAREEADREYETAKAEPLSEQIIDSIVDSVVGCNPTSSENDSTPQWLDEHACEELTGDVLQLNRNRGDEDAAVDELIDQHRRDAFADDEKQA